jgi:6-phosphogluconate dehydrogenase
MQVGLVGVGRMGGGLRGRWQAAGHEVIAYDQDAARADVSSLQELIRRLAAPRVLWVMVPAGHATEATITELSQLVERGDVIVDGGNSNYRDSIRRALALEASGVHMLDAGTSGGIWGETNGYCVMVGGPKDAVAIAEPLFAALVEEGGWEHVGREGAGHFVKMVHNGIEYGLMQAYAEGFALMRAYDEPLDLQRISGLWQHGSVVRSWLLELAERALASDPELAELRAVVDDSGEGRWMVEEAVARAVPLDVITLSLFKRFASRDDNSFAMRMLAALRREFGGHAVHTG